MYRWNISISVAKNDGDDPEDDREKEAYVAAETSKAAAIKAIQEWVADDEKIHFIHVGRQLPLNSDK